MSPSDRTWSLESAIGFLHGSALNAQVDVSRPQRGMFHLCAPDGALQGELLAITWDPATAAAGDADSGWPAKLTDAFVRGRDLVATYGPIPNWPFAPQIYWRAETTESEEAWLAAITLWVSVQTDSLDSRPRIQIATRLKADELIHVPLSQPIVVKSADDSAGQTPTDGISRFDADTAQAVCVLWRLPGGKLSYAEMISESDFRHVAVDQTPTGFACVQWELFAEFLEKGVIRRARVYSMLLPRENDLNLATDCWKSLQARPLPLTA